jgi:dynein heavy chain, axonemal
MIATCVLQTYCRLTRDRCVAIEKDFEAIRTSLQRTPANIAEVVEMREYLATVPKTVNEQRAAIDDVLGRFALLDDFAFRFTKEDFAARWDTFALPKTIFDQVAGVKTYLDLQKAIFEDLVTTKQKAFEVEINDLENEIKNFAQYTDSGKFRLIAEKAKQIEVGSHGRHLEQLLKWTI